MLASTIFAAFSDEFQQIKLAAGIPAIGAIRRLATGKGTSMGGLRKRMGKSPAPLTPPTGRVPKPAMSQLPHASTAPTSNLAFRMK